MTENKILIIAGVGAAILYFATKASAASTDTGTTQGTLDITCPTTIGVSNNTTTISVIATTSNVPQGNSITKNIKITAGTHTETKAVTVQQGTPATVTFTIANVSNLIPQNQTSLQYTVDVI